MRKLSEVRTDINKVDDQLAVLFDRRMQLAEEVAAIKQEQNLPIYDKQREKEILDKRAASCPEKDEAYQDQLRRFYQTLMDLSKERQQALIDRPVEIGYYGVPGSFTQEAYTSLFVPDGEPSLTFTGGVSFESFKEIFDALKNKQIRYGVVPAENSLTGIITDVYDLLSEYDFYIVKETQLPIRQNLLGLPGSRVEEIREVYSHPQAFAQSSAYLSSFPDWKLIPYRNTASSASYVARSGDPGKACIASQACASLYGLSVLVPDIQDHESNYTRFVVVSSILEEDPHANVVSLLFTLSHTPGSLYQVLRAFSDAGINLRRIQSRPIKGKVWEYAFFVDIEGSLKQDKVREALRRARENCLSFKLLGSYVKA